MERKAMQELIKWKNNKNRKPLLIYGARQVGKTYLMKQFGKIYFKNTIYVNFESNKLVNDMFNNESLEPNIIIKNLETIFNQKIDKDTLIIFDEIQNSPRALTSLKYFCEEALEYYIIGAGSLLGVHIKREDYSFPVGKVDILNIYPLNFEEFLINTNNDLLLKEIITCFNNNKPISEVLHKKALDLYKDYLIVGGMPEVVDDYIKGNSLISAVDVQYLILSSYQSDITKYSGASEANKILATFNSIPNQLAKDNKKFQYKLIQKGGTSSIFGDSINWLENSGVTIKCVKTKIGIPLKTYEEIDSFKIYMNDVGLLTDLSGFPSYFIKSIGSLNETSVGMLTENYVASQFKINGLNLNYWQNNTSEIDFIVQSEKGLIIPIEVKSGTNTQSKSLNNYIKEYNPKYSIRLSAKNFGFKNNIKSVPLYAAFCINKQSLDVIAALL